jgi:hypothetical protein
MREIARIDRPGLHRQEGRGIAPIAPDPAGHEIDLAYLLRVAHRQRWCILGCVLLGLAAGAYTSWRTTPAYQAAASIRIDGKAPNLPTVFRDVNNSSELTTETVVLRSRTLAEEAVSRLALQVVVTTPRGLSRSEVLGEIAVAGPLSPGEYIFKRKQGERFVVIDRTTERPLREVDAGQPVELDSLRFVLQPAASRFSEIGISILPFQAAVTRVATFPLSSSREMPAS